MIESDTTAPVVVEEENESDGSDGDKEEGKQELKASINQAGPSEDYQAEDEKT